jgi:hypothetical protein
MGRLVEVRDGVGVCGGERDRRQGKLKSPLLAKTARSGAPRLSKKQRGEMAEGAFLTKVAGMGFGVAKPWGESSRYDLIVDVEGRLVRVQVKSAHRAGEYGGYTFHAHGNSYEVYRASEIDVLVAYVVPEDAWYVFPVAVFRHYKAMKLFPRSRRRRSKFEKYREAWWVMRE